MPGDAVAPIGRLRTAVMGIRRGVPSCTVLVLLLLITGCRLVQQTYPVEVPSEVEPPTTPAQVERAVMAWIASNEQRVGLQAPPVIVSMMWAEGGREVAYHADTGLTSNAGVPGFTVPTDLWLVDVQGTIAWHAGDPVAMRWVFETSPDLINTRSVVFVEPSTLRIVGGSSPP